MGAAVCSIDGCNRPIKARGLCNGHYKRQVKHGDPLGGRASSEDLSKFIEEVAVPYKEAICLIWPFSRGGNGYAYATWNGKRSGVHRLVCELTSGPPPSPKHEAAHTCGRGHDGCVNPIHLAWKTSKENKADTLLHGTRLRGARNHRAILTEDQVRTIRTLRGAERGIDLARRFAVSPATITSIQKHENWGWLP